MSDAMDLATYSQEMGNEEVTIGYDLQPNKARSPESAPEKDIDLSDEEQEPASSIMKLIDSSMPRETQKSANESGKFKLLIF